MRIARPVTPSVDLTSLNGQSFSSFGSMAYAFHTTHARALRTGAQHEADVTMANNLRRSRVLARKSA